MPPVPQPAAPRPDLAPEEPSPGPRKVSDELDRWLKSDGDKTLGSLVELFEEKSFAILFVLLLGVPALPLPTGGATHVFEIIAMLLALELIVGRQTIWLPKRWCELELAGERQQRHLATPPDLSVRSPVEQHRLRRARDRRLPRRLPRTPLHRPRHAAGARRRAHIARGPARGRPRGGRRGRRRRRGRRARDRARPGGPQRHRAALLRDPLAAAWLGREPAAVLAGSSSPTNAVRRIVTPQG